LSGDEVAPGAYMPGAIFCRCHTGTNVLATGFTARPLGGNRLPDIGL